MAVEVDPRDHPVHGRADGRHHRAHGVRVAIPAAGPVDHRGEPRGRRRHDRRRRGGRGRPGRLHAARIPLRIATPAIYPNAPYDAANDFVTVAALGSSPNIVVVAPDKGFKTLQELVAAAKAKSGEMTFGTAGVGSSTHFTTERLRFSAGFDGVQCRSAACRRC